MKIMALDVSSKAIGWAWWDGEEISHWGTITGNIRWGVAYRLSLMRMKFAELCISLMGCEKQYKENIEYTKTGKVKKKISLPQTIFLIEDDFIRGKKPTMTLAKARGMVESVLINYCDQYEKEMIEYLLPSTWRKECFGEKRKEISKEQIIKGIQAKGYAVKNEDEADAVGLLLGYMNIQ